MRSPNNKGAELINAITITGHYSESDCHSESDSTDDEGSWQSESEETFLQHFFPDTFICVLSQVSLTNCVGQQILRILLIVTNYLKCFDGDCAEAYAGPRHGA
jgi:hypothetical protein